MLDRCKLLRLGVRHSAGWDNGKTKQKQVKDVMFFYVCLSGKSKDSQFLFIYLQGNEMFPYIVRNICEKLKKVYFC